MAKGTKRVVSTNVDTEEFIHDIYHTYMMDSVFELDTPEEQVTHVLKAISVSVTPNNILKASLVLKVIDELIEREKKITTKRLAKRFNRYSSVYCAIDVVA